jgi:hypothetical protein
VHLDTNISSKPNTEKKPNGEGNKEKAALEVLTSMCVTDREVKRTKDMFGSLPNLPHFAYLFCLRLILQFG